LIILVCFSFQEPVKKRSKLVLPAPQISESELEEVGLSNVIKKTLSLYSNTLTIIFSYMCRDTCLCESWTHQRYLSVWVLDSSEILVCVSPGLIRDTCLWVLDSSEILVCVSTGLIRDTCLCESWTHQRYLSVWVLDSQRYLSVWVLDSSLVFVTHRFLILN
jgi:hypothetical protein